MQRNANRVSMVGSLLDEYQTHISENPSHTTPAREALPASSAGGLAPNKHKTATGGTNLHSQFSFMRPPHSSLFGIGLGSSYSALSGSLAQLSSDKKQGGGGKSKK